MKKAVLYLTVWMAGGLIASPAAALEAEAVPIENGKTYYIQNVFSQKFLEVHNLFDLQQNAFTQAPEQQFRLTLEKGTGDQAIYSISPAPFQDFQWDVDQASSRNGTRLQIHIKNPNYAAAQQFQLQKNEDGTYRILSQIDSKSEKVVEIAGPSKENQAAVQIWDDVNGANQRWVLLPAWDTGRKNDARDHEVLSSYLAPVAPAENIRVQMVTGYNGAVSDSMGLIFSGDEIRGKEIVAAQDGIVQTAMYPREPGTEYGVRIILQHKDGYSTLYAHCGYLFVKEGDKVKKGDVISTVGSTGNTPVAQCYFEVRKNGRSIDPSVMIQKEN